MNGLFKVMPKHLQSRSFLKNLFLFVCLGGGFWNNLKVDLQDHCPAA